MNASLALPKGVSAHTTKASLCRYVLSRAKVQFTAASKSSLGGSTISISLPLPLPTAYSTLSCTDSAVCVGTLQTPPVKQCTLNAKIPPAGVSIFWGEAEGKAGREEWEFDFFHQTKPQKLFVQPYSETDEEIKIFEGGRDIEMKWG